MEDSRAIETYREWFRAAIGKEPFDYQMDILLRKTPFIINKARQTGISTAFGCLAARDAGGLDKKVLICSDDQDASIHILDYTWSFLRPMIDIGFIPQPDTVQRTLIQWREGGEIRSFPARPEHARGYPANTIIFDEAAHFTREERLGEKMLEAVAPSLSQAGGRLLMASTPNGTANNMFYNRWTKTPEDNRITIHWTQCPTLKVREETLPFGKRYWIEGVPFPYPEDSFRQEYCNDFFVGSSEAIPRMALEAALTDENPPPGLQGGSMGVDIGREHDLTALVHVVDTEADVVWVNNAETLNRVPFPTQQDTIRRWHNGYHPKIIVIDETGLGKETAERMGSEFPFVVKAFPFSDPSKDELIGNAWALFTAKKVLCPRRFQPIMEELSYIRKEHSEAGKTLYRDSPHGDLGWACLLALWGLKHGAGEGAVISFDY